MAVFLSVGFDFDLNLSIAKLVLKKRHELFSIDSALANHSDIGLANCDLVLFMLDSGKKEEWPGMMPLSLLPGMPDVIAAVREDDTAAAEFAIKSGCWDVLTLPCPIELIDTTIQRYLDHRRTVNESLPLSGIRRDNIIGNSPVLLRLLQRLAMVADTDSSVLLQGETGTGKELFAKAVHDNSRRAGKPLVVVDCTNLPATLAESLLFGHAKGSFTGAVESTEGLFKQADGGTIFLDEIGELDLNIQKSLLRVIQERRFRPLSAKKEISCDFRVIAATNRDLGEMVKQGGFRQDLYHRINTQTITLPPLRSRVEDIPALARHYCARFCKAQNLPEKEIAPETLEALKLYPWPGNIRELVNVMQAAVLKAAAAPRIYQQHLPEEIRLFLIRSRVTPQGLPQNGGARAAQAAGTPPFALDDAPEHLAGERQPWPFLPDSEARRSDVSAGTGLPARVPAHASAGASDNTSDGSPASAMAHTPIRASAHAPANAQVNSPAYSPANAQAHASAIAQADAPGGGEAGELKALHVPASLEEKIFDFASRYDIPTYKQARNEMLGKMEPYYLAALMRKARKDFNKAREISGLSRARLYELLKNNKITASEGEKHEQE